VPSTCGKLQAWRGLADKARGARGASARHAARPRAGIAMMFGGCVVVLAATAQEGTRRPPDLLVTSALERIDVVTDSDAAAPAAITSAATTSQTDELIVSVRFTNSTEQVLDTIRITSPVPPDLRYVAESASGPGSDVLFSIDDGRTFGLPEELTLATPDGGVRGADAADYTHVRWILRAPLDAGATGIARFRAVRR
jgi:hypothetical protein